MAVSPQHLNLKRWKRKFLGIAEEGTDVREDVYAKAQKLINIFRQLSVLSKESIEHYNEMVLNISPDIRSVLSTLPCGSDVRGYISYLQERRGLPIEEDDEDDLEMSEGRKQAEIIAEAISKSTSKTAEQMQEQSMKQVELLTKTLAEAQSKNASIDDIAKITAAIQAAQAANPAIAMPAAGGPVPTQKVKKKTKDENGKEIEIEVEEPIPGAQGGYYPVAMGAPLVSGDGAAAAAAIGNAVADAIVKSQQQTSEIIAKMLGDAISKPQQVQNDSLKEISGMLAASQEKTANIILASVGDALSKPQQVQNDNIKEIAAMLADSNEKTVNAISTSIREALSGSPLGSRGENGEDTINQLATLIASSQDKTAKTILEALGSVLDNSPETGGGLKEVAKMLTESQEKTASIIANSLATIASKEEKQESGKQDTVMMMLEAQEENTRLLTQILGKLAEKEGVSLPDTLKDKDISDAQTGKGKDKSKAKAKELALALEPEVDENLAADDDDTPLFGDFDESEFFSPHFAPKPAPNKSSAPAPAPAPEPDLQDTIAELRDTLEKIDETIEPEYAGDTSGIPENAPSSSDSQPSDIDTDFEYEFYELDENGNLVPFNPELNPDVEYEIVEDIEEGSDRLASFAKTEQLAVPDITDSLEDLKDVKPEPEENKAKQAKKSEEKPASSSFTDIPVKGKIDFEGLFEEDYDATDYDYDIIDDYPSSWINNFASASASAPKPSADKLFAHDVDLDIYEEENPTTLGTKKKTSAKSAKPAKEQKLLTNSTKAIGYAPAKKEIEFAATKELAAPAASKKADAPESKPKAKTKAKTKTKAKAKTKAKTKVKAEKIKQKSISAPLAKKAKKDKSAEDKSKSDTKNYWIKDKSKKTAASTAKNKKRPFVIMFSDSETEPEKIEID